MNATKPITIRVLFNHNPKKGTAAKIILNKSPIKYQIESIQHYLRPQI